MTPIEFLRTVWPAQGLYCIATPYPSGAMKHKVFETIDAAAAYSVQQAATENVFFCVHTLDKPRVWNEHKTQDKVTKEWVAGWSERTQVNTRAGKVFFWDLDVGLDEPGKLPKYPTQKDAVADLIRFVNVTKLPMPMLVSSGGGVHVYWVLDQEMDSNSTWVTWAARLKQLALHYKLKLDTSRTTDTASVLRVAGTFNRKPNKPVRPVEVKQPSNIIEIEAWCGAIMAALDAVNLKAKSEKKVDEGLGFNTKREFDKPPPPMTALIKACGQMRRLATLMGCNSEPEWYWGDIGVVKFTENGRENCHKISAGFKDYNRAECDAKIDHWSTGPTTCEKLNEVCGEANKYLCEQCSFVGQNSSPIWAAHLANVAEPPVVKGFPGSDEGDREIPNPPPPYRRLNKGGIEILMENKEGKQYTVAIYPYDLYPIERSFSASKETELQSWRAILPHDTIRDFTIEASVFTDDRMLQAKLANHGVYTTKFPDLKGYMSAYIQQLIRNAPVSVQHNHLGWTDDKTKFVLSDKSIDRTGKIASVALGSVAAQCKEFVCKGGSLQEQVKLMQFFNRPEYLPNQFVILSGFGAPCFKLTGHHGVIVNAAGETGASKSTALFTAASFWGRPEKYVLNGNSSGSTALARDIHRDILGNLPCCIDEITNIAPELAQDFALNVTQGKTKTRANRDGTLQKTGDNDRSTMVLTTANISLHSLLHINNSAGQASSVRVFEVQFHKLGIHEPWEADAYLRALNQNFGWLGEIFIHSVAKNFDAVMRRIIVVSEELARSAHMHAEERFWFAAAASNIVAGEIAYHLHLIPFDIGAIRNWLVVYQLPYLRGVVHEEAQVAEPVNVLTEYLEHINGNIVKISKPFSGGANVLQKPEMREVLAHWDDHKHIMYVLKEGFRSYCTRRGLYSQGLLKELNLTGVVPVIERKITLGLGTELAKARSSCFLIDMSHKDIAEVKLAIVSSPAGVAQVNISKKE